ncbi:MAG: acyl-CoA-binding protein [Segetibacter sp.]|nr:acyl-CoA-binding protein [Segetibacter sp.]
MVKLYPPKIFCCENSIFTTQKTNLKNVKSSFYKAVEESNLLHLTANTEVSLQLYSLYKQATQGDINFAPTNDPIDEIAKAKYEAWASLKGKSMAEAKSEYIKLVNSLKNPWH